MQDNISTQRMRRIRRMHLVGIGGAGMGGIAEVLHTLGYQVSGSDISSNAIIRRLQKIGVTVYPMHQAEHVAGVDVIVYSNAIKPDNPEIVSARERGIPVVPRGEMLAELMRFRENIAVIGTHGKTTTTSLIAHVLTHGGFDPTYVIGGQLLNRESHAQLGTGRYLVAEVDESDSCFQYVNPIITVLTNIDADHLSDFGGDLQKLYDRFLFFLGQLPFYGLAVACIDDPGVKRILPQLQRPVLTYGFSAEADISVKLIRHEFGSVVFSVSIKDRSSTLQCKLNMPGVHNIRNALAAITIGIELGVDVNQLVESLARFPGIARRCEHWGQLIIGDMAVELFDDYGHHPTEIEFTIQALHQGWKDRRLIVLFQPHRYTRTRDLFDEFSKVFDSCDVVVLLPVYSAGEDKIVGADSHALARQIRISTSTNVVTAEDADDAIRLLLTLLHDTDILLTLGAGNVGRIPELLWDEYGKGVSKRGAL